MATPLEQLEGKYELLEKIREGGMGSVYKVRHELLDEVRVIKVMRPQLADDENLKMRFLREAKMAIRLRHPNLAQIYDFTMDENGYAYLVMEYIEGLELSPDNTEAKRLLKVVEASDVKLQQRRQQAVDDVRKLILAGDLERAEARLQTSVETDGAWDDSERLRAEIGDTKERAEERRRQIAEMTERVDQLMADASFDEAISVVQDALVIDPRNQELRSRLDAAKTGLARQRVEQRREQEVRDTAATITRHLENKDAEQAGRALSVAVKLYGELDVFNELAARLVELRAAQRLAAATELQDTARALMKDADFSSALAALEEAHRIAPEAQATSDLLAAAREGIRLQEETQRRRMAIDQAALNIDRLVEKALEGDRPFEEVFADLESAGALDPHNERVQRVLAQTKAARRRHDEERAAENAAEAMAQVDRLIAEGETGKALSTLDEAVRQHGEFRAARILRSRLESYP